MIVAELEQDIQRAIGLLRQAGKPDKYLEEKYGFMKNEIDRMSVEDLINNRYTFHNDGLADYYLCKDCGFKANYKAGAIIHSRKIHKVYTNLG